MKVLKYFTAEWCQPCKQFKPVVQELQFEGYNVQFIDIERRPNAAMENNIRSVPTILIEKGGKVVDRFSGVKSKAFVKHRYDNA